jgi:putative restriction endonuclease
VNFWSPSGTGFRALEPGEPFFFKLKAPANAIGGFGIFIRAERLPVWLAWESLGEANGSATEAELLRLLNQHRSADQATSSTQIVCRVLAEPVFFPEEYWVPTPRDWSKSIVAGKGYDLATGDGAELWQRCLEAASYLRSSPPWIPDARERARFGKPILVRPRLGQGSFRLAVFDAYDRRCSVTGEHSVPVLEAAHIKPYASGGEHLVSNGLSLRRDLHRLFDLGYVTIRPDYSFEVGDRLRTEYDNGKIYYELNGRTVHVPRQPELRPSQESLTYHNEHVYRAA